MPRRTERLLWVYAKDLDAATSGRISDRHLEFASEWQDSSVTVHTCVDTAVRSSRSWLFQLPVASDGQRLASRFNNDLEAHLSTIRTGEDLASGSLKRQKALPTPLITGPLGDHPRVDLGLHSVNDDYNGMLTTYIYHAGRYYNPPHLQAGELQRTADMVSKLWRRVACSCRDGSCARCGGLGCYWCFEANCPECAGTGWREYSRWAGVGYPVDYSSGYPIAQVSGSGGGGQDVVR